MGKKYTKGKKKKEAKFVSFSRYGYFQQHSFVVEIERFSLKELETHSSCSSSLSSSNIRDASYETTKECEESGETEIKAKVLVTLHENLHAYGKAKGLPGAQEQLHFLRNSQRILQGLMVEGNLLLAWQKGEPLFPFSLM